MCWFLTVASTEGAARLLPQPARAPELRAEPQHNASIVRALADVARLPERLQLWSVTRNGCSCDLVRASTSNDGFEVREDVRALLARIVEERHEPLAFLFHTYGGPTNEAFSIVKGPRLTPDELRAPDLRLPADALCVVREVPRFDDRVRVVRGAR